MIAYITGASSGLGAYTAQALVDTGWTVVAGARSFTGETDGRMTRLPLDVTRDDSVRDFMERAKQIGVPETLVEQKKQWPKPVRFFRMARKEKASPSQKTSNKSMRWRPLRWALIEKI